MKKIFSILIGILLSCNMCFAVLPQTSVFIEEHPQKQAVIRAFSTWQAACDNIIRFRHVSSRAHIPNLTVVFSNSTYRDNNFPNAVGLASTRARTLSGNSAKATITIWLKSPDGRPLSNDEIYHVALHEIGHTLGLGHSSSQTDIMYPYVNSQTTLSQNDILRVKQLLSR